MCLKIQQFSWKSNIYDTIVVRYGYFCWYGNIILTNSFGDMFFPNLSRWELHITPNVCCLEMICQECCQDGWWVNGLNLLEVTHNWGGKGVCFGKWPKPDLHYPSGHVCNIQIIIISNDPLIKMTIKKWTSTGTNKFPQDAPHACRSRKLCFSQPEPEWQ